MQFNINVTMKKTMNKSIQKIGLAITAAILLTVAFTEANAAPLNKKSYTWLSEKPFVIALI
ncbi:MAG: hypothetical protein RLZZ379_1369, partial [Pseudomonadota bacterium]